MFGGFGFDDDFDDFLDQSAHSPYASSATYNLVFLPDESIDLAIRGIPNSKTITLPKTSSAYRCAREAFKKVSGFTRLPQCQFSNIVNTGFSCRAQISKANPAFSKKVTELLKGKRFDIKAVFVEKYYANEVIKFYPNRKSKGIELRKNTQLYTLFKSLFAQYGV